MTTIADPVQVPSPVAGMDARPAACVATGGKQVVSNVPKAVVALDTGGVLAAHGSASFEPLIATEQTRKKISIAWAASSSQTNELDTTNFDCFLGEFFHVL